MLDRLQWYFEIMVLTLRVILVERGAVGRMVQGVTGGAMRAEYVVGIKY